MFHRKRKQASKLGKKRRLKLMDMDGYGECLFAWLVICLFVYLLAWLSVRQNFNLHTHIYTQYTYTV